MQGWDTRPRAFQILGRGIESVWQIVISAPWLLPGAIAAYALVNIGIAYMSNLLPVSLAQEFAGASAGHRQAYANVVPLQLLRLAGVLITSGITTFPFVIVYRHILLGETGFRPPLPVLWRYAAWCAVVEVLGLVPDQLEYVSDAWWTSVVPIVASMALAVLLSLVFPGIAIGVTYKSVWERARSGVRHLRGNFWLLLRVFLIIFTAAITSAALLYVPNFLFHNPIEIAPASWPVLSFEAVIVVGGSFIAAGAMAWLYAWAVPSSQWLDNFD